MALTDLHSTGTVPTSARFVRSSPRSDIPYDALAQLSALRGETGRNLRLLQVLARSPQACLILMLAGAGTLVWASAGPSNATLKSEFGWALCVLIGIAAMTLNYIHGFAQSLRRTPLHQALSNLRLLLLYTGAAWGMGAFLVMPELPAPALVACFAAGPSLALTLLLKDAPGAAAFTVPATLACVGAAILGSWPFGAWAAGFLLMAGALICCLPVLQNMIHWRRNALPEAAPH